MPLITPPLVIVAMLEPPLTQVSPPVALNVIVDPRHTAAAPLIAEGFAFIVAIVVVKQPVDARLYVITDVPPATPPTDPPLTVATPVLLLDHVSPPELLNMVAEPAHT